MKKFIPALIALFFICMQAFAKDDSDWSKRDNAVAVLGGIRFDAAFLNFIKTGAPGTVSTQTPGCAVGGLVNIRFNKWIGRQTAGFSFGFSEAF